MGVTEDMDKAITTLTELIMVDTTKVDTTKITTKTHQFRHQWVRKPVVMPWELETHPLVTAKPLRRVRRSPRLLRADSLRLSAHPSPFQLRSVTTLSVTVKA